MSGILDAHTLPGRWPAARDSSTEGTAHSRQGGLASALPSGGWGGVGWGAVRVVMGTRRHLAGWGRTRRPSLAMSPASALTTHSGPRSVLEPLHGLYPLHCLRVWPQQAPGVRRGRSSHVLLSGQRAACWPPDRQKTGAVGAWGRAGEIGQASIYPG